MNRLNRLFEHFIRNSELCRKRGGELKAFDGRLIGYIDIVQVVGSRLIVQGWSVTRTVKLRLGGGQAEVTPNIDRTDLVSQESIDGRSAMGFSIALPFQDSPYQLEVEEGEFQSSFERTGFSKSQIRLARCRYLPSFLWMLIRIFPSLCMWALTNKQRWRSQAKTLLGLTEAAKEGKLTIPLEIPPQVTPVPITIILPVFNAYDILCECLERVAEHTDCPMHLVIIDDASTDRRVWRHLVQWRETQELKNPGSVTLVQNQSNLGFIGTVNHGFELAIPMGNHVVLLNSDALLPKDWATRLLAPILSDASVASVTPMSNDAEIFSVPVVCQKGSLAKGAADKIDAVAGSLPLNFRGSDAPTGVGFCMAMNHDFLLKVPKFDTVFGRGYGEEVDWCQRTRALGGRHLAQPRLFVEHRGGASFGSDSKKKLIRRNNSRISRRYPSYNSDVQDYISRDPLRTVRLALGLAKVGQEARSPIPLYLAHSWGGGAELYLRHRLQGDIQDGGAAIVLRVGGPCKWRLELHTSLGETSGVCDDIQTIERLLAAVESLRIIYSCGVGHPLPNEIPSVLLRIAKDRLVDVLFHDYFPLTPSYHLLDSNSEYRGVPEATSDDAAHRFDGGLESGPVSLVEWRAAWGRLLGRADRLVTFSNSSADLLAQSVPKLSRKIVIQPHALHEPVAPIEPKEVIGDNVGILGNISAHKGADVVRNLSVKYRQIGRGELVLLGKLDPAFQQPNGLIVHGEYDLRDLNVLVKKYKISTWVIPSIWPETFSYTTHEALATGLPVIVFDLGAQAEAARKASNGLVVPMGDAETGSQNILTAITGLQNSMERYVA